MCHGLGKRPALSCLPCIILNPAFLTLFTPPRTVSADPSLHEECFKGAKFLLRILESIGCGAQGVGWRAREG